MQKLSQSEWLVMDVLWSGDSFLLGEIVDKLYEDTRWSRNTVHTYLTRMEKKGLVTIDRSVDPHRYSYKISRDEAEREVLLNKVYGGSVGDLVAAFLKESKITAEEKAKLNKLLDDMEV